MDNNNHEDNWKEERRREREERLRKLREERKRYDYIYKGNEEKNKDYTYADYYTEKLSEERARENEKKKPTKKPKKHKARNILVVLLCVLLSGALGFAGGYFGSMLFDKHNPRVVNKNSTENITINPSDEIGVVEAVAQKAIPSVVGITATSTVETIFGPQKGQGVGTGVIVDSNGYILTNSHVISDGKASKIEVMLDEDKTVEAKLLWFDNYMDLAVIKVNETGLPAAELGDSDDVNIGEQAIAIGNPLGLEYNRSLTAGYISGVNRTVDAGDGRMVEGLIQTDAAINQGNSGGPLLNAKGEVIGINTMKIGGTATEGLGFAIPINTAKEIVNAIINRGDKAPVLLGVRVVDYNYYKARMGLVDNIEGGVIVLEVEPGSIADKSGIRRGDILLELDGVKLDGSSQIRTILFKHTEGDKVKLTYISNNDKKTIELEIK
ncbi:MAG: trypsin-like peptidase domain-containing protein [Ezakiella sp.]|nr:trypsin-like peptidase domain-containing protein [Ezakiella sp.]